MKKKASKKTPKKNLKKRNLMETKTIKQGIGAFS